MAADKTGPERQEIPLRTRRLQNCFGVDAHLVEDHRQLVDQRNVEVALRILDYLRGLGDLDAARLVCARHNDLVVKRIDDIGDLGRGPRGHLPDRRQPVLLVAGIDAFRAVTGVEVAVEFQA